MNDQLEGITEQDLFSLINICMKNVKTELVSYEENIKKKLLELKGEAQLDFTKLDISRISNSNNELPKMSNDDPNNNKRKISNNSKHSQGSKKSNEYKHSNKSNG